MMNGKCCKNMRLCPVSFGLAWGITYGLTIFIMSVIIMHNGTMPGVSFVKAEDLTWMVTVTHTVVALIEGFVYGAVFALIYDCVLRIGKCCRGCGNGCSCGCCDSDKKGRR